VINITAGTITIIHYINKIVSWLAIKAGFDLTNITNAEVNQCHHAGPSGSQTPQVADPETCLVFSFPAVILLFFVELLFIV
jgi:hypothetical protein